MSTTNIVNSLTQAIIYPLIMLLFAVALLVFFWGVIEFLLALNAGGEASKEAGKLHMLWGLIGMFVIVSAGSLLTFIANNACGGLSSCASTPAITSPL